MRCPECGAKNPRDASFCDCGHPLPELQVGRLVLFGFISFGVIAVVQSHIIRLFFGPPTSGSPSGAHAAGSFLGALIGVLFWLAMAWVVGRSMNTTTKPRALTGVRWAAGLDALVLGVLTHQRYSVASAWLLVLSAVLVLAPWRWMTLGSRSRGESARIS